MTTPFHIRPMYATDFQRGFREVLSALSPVTLPDEDAMKIFRSRLRFGVATFVAVAGERVIGTASLLLETKFIHNGGRVGHVEDVAVDPEYQGQGIGQALIHHLIEVCREEGCYKLILDCNPKLVSWYSKLGFREWCHAMRLDIEVPAHGPPESPPHQP